MKTNDYYERIVDATIEKKLRIFGAVNIVGAKGCGKTKTALMHSKSSLMLQNNVNSENLKTTAKISPDKLLIGEQPRLIDEWQDAPSIWDAVRYYCDMNPGQGHFILTGSSSSFVETKHTGTGRISTLKMHTMSLYESKESNGCVSLKALFDNKEDFKNKSIISDLSLEDLIFAACRGGWPYSLMIKDKDYRLEIAKDYYKQIYERDILQADASKNSTTTKAVLKSYARNIATLAKKTNILADVDSTNKITDKTLDDYIEDLEKLHIIDDLYGYSPMIRSKNAVRVGRKRMFMDPSIAVAAMGGSPKLYETDLLTFGFIFENLCVRDLRIYSQSIGGELSYYRDRNDLEIDTVLHLEDGRYALIEIKLGDFEFEKAANNLNKFEKLVIEHNKTNKIKLRAPDLKIILTGTKYGYKRPDGVYVIPIGCLKD